MGFLSKAVKAVSSPLGIIANPGIGLATKGLSTIGKQLGLNLEGEQGEYATPQQQQQALYRAFANDYDNQMKQADQGVQNSDLTKGLYGAGGLQEQLGNENKQLSNQGFQLTDSDRTAYGQASGDIARQFGQQEQDVAKSLARRGLASAGSGAAGALYSGLAGNKNEMLAKSQMDIAQRRYEDTMNRLNNVRNQMQSLGLAGSQLAQQRYATKGQSLMNAVDVEKLGNEQNRQALEDKQNAYKPGLFETIGQSIQSGIGNMASQAPGLAVGGLTGGKFGTMNNYQATGRDLSGRSLG
jgi:hypothetical protein